MNEIRVKRSQNAKLARLAPNS